jgi:hypothetical protein
LNQKQQTIYNLIQSIIIYLQSHHTESAGVSSVLKKLGQMDLTEGNILGVSPQGTRHSEILNTSIDGITLPSLSNIASALKIAKKHLVWREDDGKYYQQGADLGEGYRNCNLHSLLIGPGACGYEHPDFNLGIFMLGPRTLYRDHCHQAPELYLNLADRSGWRLQGGDWIDYPAGSIIWNEPGELHATRVYKQPFISVFVWLEKVHAPCQVVPMSDWPTLEQALLL